MKSEFWIALITLFLVINLIIGSFANSCEKEEEILSNELLLVKIQGSQLVSNFFDDSNYSERYIEDGMINHNIRIPAKRAIIWYDLMGSNDFQKDNISERYINQITKCKNWNWWGSFSLYVALVLSLISVFIILKRKD